MFHPWRLLRSRPHLRLVVDDLGDDGPLGTYDGRTITLTTRLLQVERRCAVLHELIHDERGIPHEHDPAEEIAVEREVARRLIPIDALIRVAKMGLSLHDAADELWVTEDVLRCRLASITHPAERRAWRAALEQMGEHGGC